MFGVLLSVNMGRVILLCGWNVIVICVLMGSCVGLGVIFMMLVIRCGFLLSLISVIMGGLFLKLGMG